MIRIWLEINLLKQDSQQIMLKYTHYSTSLQPFRNRQTSPFSSLVNAYIKKTTL